MEKAKGEIERDAVGRMRITIDYLGLACKGHELGFEITGRFTRNSMGPDLEFEAIISLRHVFLKEK
eukprot:767240-Hanusia_phi.AAC.1